MKCLAIAILLGAQVGCAHRLVTSDGDQIVFDVRGQGPTIVVLAGGPAAHAPLYDRAYAPLERFARVIYWDYAGTGKSVAPTRATMNDDMEDLDGVIVTHGGRAILLAHSYGTMLAVNYAALHPERVQALILVGAHESSQDFAPGSKIEAARLGADGARFDELGQRCFRDGCSAAEARELMRLDARGTLHDQKLVDEIASESVFNPDPARSRGADIGAYDARKLHVAAPTLIIDGADDPYLAGARALANDLHAQLEIFAGSGHYPFFEEPARFSATVEKFVSAMARTTTDAQASPNAPVTKPAVP